MQRLDEAGDTPEVGCGEMGKRKRLMYWMGKERDVLFVPAHRIVVRGVVHNDIT
jgi:hypothetical protein